MKLRPTVLLIAIALLFNTTVIAQEGIETQILVRAVAHDAKIIGSNVGGARITIQEVATGIMLAEGIQKGGTGNTQLIMSEPRKRDATVFDTEGAAGFLATINLNKPTLVDITAYGPLSTPHATQRTSKRILLVPGKHILGEGLILEINGFTVEILSPADVPATVGETVELLAKITMLWGCPTEPVGLWDANNIEIEARLIQDGNIITTSSLSYAGKTSTYRGEITAPSSGSFSLEVIASDTSNVNFGMVRKEIVAVEANK